MKFKAILALSALLFAAPVFADGDDDKKKASEWSVDKNHSAINFNVKHFFTPVNGTFKDYDISLDFNAEDLESSSINVTIQVASVDTGVEKRNNHLKTADFFDAEQFPTIVFASSSIESTGENTFVAKGTLTMRGVEKPYELPFELLGVADLPEQMQRGGMTKIAGFKSHSTLLRNDWGVGTGSWAATAVVGGEVNLEIAIEAKQ